MNTLSQDIQQRYCKHRFEEKDRLVRTPTFDMRGHLIMEKSWVKETVCIKCGLVRK